MKILFVDEDIKDTPQFCDGLRQLNCDVLQIMDISVESLKKASEFNPDAIILDLMMPPDGIPKEKCGSGYTTGAYFYTKTLNKLFSGRPFVVLTAADVQTLTIKRAIDGLKLFSEFKGVFEKGVTEEDLLEAF